MFRINSITVQSWLKDYWIIITLILIKLAVHFATCTIYELQRDAFLYSALGDHPAWGYHSVPPSIAVFAKISRLLFGDTAFALRFFPAVTGALSIALIGLMVREMRGNKLAQFISCLAFLTATSFLRSNSLFQPVSFNQFYWLLLSFLIFRLISTNRSNYWIWIGIVSGLAFLNKYSVVFFLFAFVLSIFLTPLRKWLRTMYPYLAVTIAFVLALPNLLWQLQNHWPVIKHMRELAEYQLVHVRTDLFLAEQIMMNLPALFIWIPGLLFILFHKSTKNYRIFGFIYTLPILTPGNQVHLFTSAGIPNWI